MRLMIDDEDAPPPKYKHLKTVQFQGGQVTNLQEIFQDATPYGPSWARYVQAEVWLPKKYRVACKAPREGSCWGVVTLHLCLYDHIAYFNDTEHSHVETQQRSTFYVAEEFRPKEQTKCASSTPAS